MRKTFYQLKKTKNQKPKTKNQNKMKIETNTSVGLLVRVSFSKFAPVVNNKKSAREYAATHSSDEQMHSSSMRLVHKRFTEPLQKVETKCRQFVDSQTLPWEKRGNSLLPADLVPAFQNGLIKLRQEWSYAVDEFVAEYDKIVEDAKIRLNGDFRQHAYPNGDEVRKKFLMTVSYMPMPDNNRLVDSIREDMCDLFQRRLDAASATLRERLCEKLEHLAARCATQEGKFYASNLSNVVELCDLIPAMLVQDDQQLLAAVADAKEMLLHVGVDDVKNNEQLRSDLRRKAASIVAALQ